MVADPDRAGRRHSTCSTPAERDAGAPAWNDTAAGLPGRTTLTRLIAAQAARTPDAVAVQFEGDSPDLRRAGRRAPNRLAHRLRGAGVGPETVVAVCAERSAELVVALLGVLKAGGAYLPLDPEYPADRLAFMLADAAAPVVLTAGGTCATCCRDATRPVLALDDADGLGRPEPATDPTPRPARRTWRTSSTPPARPAGPRACRTRTGASSTGWTGCRRTTGSARDDAVLQKTPFSFDVSVWEFFWPLHHRRAGWCWPGRAATATPATCATC